jgi:Tol biopolymer transport system component
VTTILDGNGPTVVASTDSQGGAENGSSSQVVLSPDGTKIAFASVASNLVPTQFWGRTDIFVKDLLTGEVTRVSTDVAGAEPDRPSSNPVFSPDGSKVAFLSAATNLVPGVADGSVGVFVKDLVSGAIQRIAGGVSGDMAFSPDGSQLIFESSATNLVSGDTNGQDDIFVADLASGALQRVSTTQQGEQANGRSEAGVFSPDGTKIAFASAASNLVAGDGNGLMDIFVKDLASGVLERFSGTQFGGDVASAKPVFSPDGSRIAFDGSGEIFLVNLATSERTAVSINDAQSTANIFSLSAVFSPDGSKIAFWAWGWSGGPNILIKDLTTGGLAVAVPGMDGVTGMQSSSFDLSWVGNMLAFSARTSGGVAPGDSPAYEYAYIRQLSIASVAPLDAVKLEGNWGETTYTFTITRSGDLSAEQSIGWGVSGVSFDGHPRMFDFPWPSGTVDFAPGETTKTIAVQVKGDGLVEPDQYFLVSLNNATGGLLFDNGPAKGVILNDDMQAHSDAYIIGPGGVLHDSTSIPDTHPRIGVLANDDSTGPLTASLVTGPAHGTVVLAADGHFDYKTDAGFTGIDRFVYNASGSTGQANGQVLIYVVPELSASTPTLNLLALTAEEQIVATYVAFFGRGADAAGFQFWLDQFHSGQATQEPAALLANIASSFAVSDEAKVLYPFLAQPHGPGDPQISGFLGGVYSNLFGRPPDADGVTYWTNRINYTLEQGGFVGSVLVDIMSGTQNRSDGPQDITRLMGKVSVSLAYVTEQQLLGTHWSPDQLAEAREMVQAVSESPASVLMGITYAENIVLGHALAALGGP